MADGARSRSVIHPRPRAVLVTGATSRGGRLGVDGLLVARGPVADLYRKACFGERFGRADLGAFRPALRGFSETFRARVGWPRRILGMMSPLGAARRP